MKFWADENFPFAAYRVLWEFGYDIKHVAQEMPSVADIDVTNFAIRKNRIILTFDGDFGTLIFKFDYCPPGVIFFRLYDIKPEDPAYVLMNILNEAYQIENMHTVVENDKIRQRRIQ